MSDAPSIATTQRGNIEQLSPHAPPCRYFRPDRWTATRVSCPTCTEQFGAEAHQFPTSAERSDSPS